jgi:uncharacterized membrane protein HdeD (DUF308 family)
MRPFASALSGLGFSLAVRGVLAILLGIGAFAWPGATLLAIVFLFGAFALADGITAISVAVVNIGYHAHWAALLAIGILSLAAGLIAFTAPGLALLALLWLIAAWAVAGGVFEIAAGIRVRNEITGEWRIIVAGALSVLFGIVLFAYPAAGAAGILFALGAFGIVYGITSLSTGIYVRRLHAAISRIPPESLRPAA